MRSFPRTGGTLAVAFVAAGLALSGLLPTPAMAGPVAPTGVAAVPIAAASGGSVTGPGRAERDLVPPDGKGKVPTKRTDGTTLFVCGTSKEDIDKRVAGYPTDQRVGTLSLWTQCQTGGFRTLQDAVNNVKNPGTTIKILPGVYLEPDSTVPAGTAAGTPPAGTASTGTPPAGTATTGAPATNCADLPDVLSYAQQVACPAEENLIAVLGKVDLQIEGVGAKAEDVVIDGAFRRPYVLRADRSPGLYLRNFTVQHATVSAIYVLESDGFALDGVLARYNTYFGLSAVADDHGLISQCEAYGNGSAGISVSAAPNLNVANHHSVDRYAIEVHNCDSHDNLIGFAGSAANSVWVHDDAFTDNSVGMAIDSAAKLPGQPQNHALFENNEIGANNRDYYGNVRDGTCAKPSGQRGYDTGVVCPSRPVPPGTGVLTLGGNYDIWRTNWVYGNSYAGFMLAWTPGYFRGDPHVKAQLDTSHHNRVYNNQLGVRPDGASARNGMDYWWDGQGIGSCMQRPSVSSVPRVLPPCGASDLPSGLGTSRYLPEPTNALILYACTRYDAGTAHVPGDCSWYGATGLGRIEVRVALGGAILLGLVLLVTWWRLLRGSRLALLGTMLALAGLVAGVYGTIRLTSPLTGVGLGLLGLGWFAFGASLRRRGRPALGWLTLFMSLFALLGAADHLLMPIPWLPAPPALIRVFLEFLWTPAAVVAAINGQVLAGAAPPRPVRPGRTPRTPRRPRRNRDPLESFAAALRE